MKRTRLLLGLLCIAPGLLLAACSDDDGEKKKDTGTVKKDSKVDPPKPDLGPDQKVTTPDKGPDGVTTPDKGADGVTKPDISADGALPDQGAPMPDMPKSTCTLPFKYITLKNGKGSTTGEIKSSDTKSNITLASTGCASAATPGADHIYAVYLKGGGKYAINLAHDSGYNAALYVFTDCAKAAATCLAGTDKNYGSDKYEYLSFTATSTGIFYIAVDSSYKPGVSYSYGKYTLTVSEDKPPVNDTCAKASTLSFPAGKMSIAESGSTMQAKNSSSLTSSGCTKKTSDGPDVFYKVKLTSGNLYKFELTGGSGFNASMYLVSDCTKIASSCVKGADEWTSSAEEISFTPTATKDYYVVVDGRASTDKGIYSLTIDEFKKPANDTCAKATKLPISGGKGSVNGHTIGATNSVSFTSTGCTKASTQGPDVFYAVDLTAGKSYRITATPASGYNHAIYLLSSCTAPTSSCVGGTDANYSGSVEKFDVTITKTGTYYIGVDTSYAASSTYAQGKFTLDVAEVIPPANNTCAKASALTLSGGKGSATGDSTMATNTVNMASTGCTGYDTEGPDMFYKVSLTGGKSYKIKLTPASGYNPALYVVSSCTKPTSSCLIGSDSASSGSAEELIFSPQTTGTYTVGVDTSYASSSSYATGKFTLELSEFVAAKGDVCTKPLALTWAAGEAKASGDTTNATNTLKFSSSTGCTDSTAKGPEVFYSINLTAGKAYKVTVTPASGYDVAAYAFSSCASPLSSCLGGSDAGYTGTAETFTLKAKTTGPHIIAVDGSSSTSKGTFSISVKEFIPPSNDSCKTAKKIALTGGAATVKGSKAGATSELAKCGTTTLSATDLWYKFTPVTGTKYKITFTPAGGGGRFGVWDGSHSCVASAVETACGKLGSKFVTGGSSDSLTITGAGTDIYFVADGISSSYNIYDFTFTITALTKPPNDICTKVQNIKWVSGVATITGDNTAATNTVTMTSSNCTGKAVQGGDMFYNVALTAGKNYEISVAPQSGFDVAVWVFKSCTKIAATCVAGADKASSGSSESILFTPATSGTYGIGIGTKYTTGASYSQGSFTITVKEYVPPPDSCAKAAVLKFDSTGTAKVSGDTSKATDSVKLTSSGCTTYSSPGPDVFYKVTLTGGQSYTVTLTPESAFDSMLYVFTDCSKPEASCVGGHDNLGSGNAETVKVSPKVTGTYLIGVDSYSSTEYGKFTLTVK